MHRIVIIILFSAFLLSCGRKEVIDFYPNGNKKSILHYKHKKLDGVCEYYFTNKQPQSIFNYKNGKLEGRSIRYYFEGTVEYIAEYSDGKLNGKTKSYYKNGDLKEIKTYKNDSLDGLYQMYLEGGVIKIEGIYSHNKFDSIWNYYDRFGQTVGKGEFNKGTGELISYHKNGEIKHVIPYVNNEKKGIEKFYDKAGNLIKTERW